MDIEVCILSLVKHPTRGLRVLPHRKLSGEEELIVSLTGVLKEGHATLHWYGDEPYPVELGKKTLQEIVNETFKRELRQRHITLAA